MKLAYPVGTPEVRGKILGYTGPIERVCAELRELGYAGIEPFVCNPEAFDAEGWSDAVKRSGLAVAAVGTGPVVLDDRLTFTDADETVRRAAVARAKLIVRFAARFGAQVNIGKLRGDLPPGAEARARQTYRLGAGTRGGDFSECRLAGRNAARPGAGTRYASSRSRPMVERNAG